MDLMESPLARWFDRVADIVVANKKMVLVGSAIVVAGIVGFIGYGYYTQRIQRISHADLIMALQYFDAPVTKSVPKDNSIYFSSEQEKWKEVAYQFNAGYKKHASSTLAPMFLAFHSEALINLGEREEAIRSLTEAVNTMGNAKMRGYYQLKLALMQLDSEDAQLVKQGHDTLRKIAYDQKHIAHDQALYQLGLFLWINKKYEEAKNFWQQFVVKYGNEQGLESQVRVVRSKLDLIAV